MLSRHLSTSVAASSSATLQRLVCAHRAVASVTRCTSTTTAATATSSAISKCAITSSAARSLHTRSSALNNVTPSSSPPSSTSSNTHNNVTPGISSKIGKNLHLQPGHPLNIIKSRIAYYFEMRAKEAEAKANAAGSNRGGSATPANHRFTLIDNVSPIVTAQQNFDDLLVPASHPGRSLSDTFYYSPTSLLRTHTSAHQCEYMRSGLSNFLVVGDCYRRDEIDASHYPVFHQMEGVKLFTHDVARYNRQDDGVALVVADLKDTLDGLIRYLFGSDIEVRWIDAYFPFTHPSFEMEIFFNGKWLEVFGCGVIQYSIMDQCSPPLVKGQTNGWAFGLGLERLAMVLFDIPDIRLFWSDDSRFLEQFIKVREDLHASNGKFKQIKFQPFSKYPACFKDVAFWIPASEEGKPVVTTTPSSTSSPSISTSTPLFHENDFCSMVREIAGDLVENVACIDSFVHPKTKQTSKCYRIMYRSLNRNLTNEEIDVLQEQVRAQIGTRLGLKLR